MDLFSLSVVIEIIVAITLGKNLGLLHQIGALVKDTTLDKVWMKLFVTTEL